MPQLDGLRALAAFAVLFFHFYIKEHDNNHGALSKMPWGEWGVHLFFVLSGFLITGILLRCRQTITDNRSRNHQLKQFYIRRSLRIFPLFYLVVFVAFLLNMPDMRESVLWHLSYLSNIYFAKIGEFKGTASHFWSLAVEEQFYLFWPFLMLFLPRKALLPCIVLAIFSTPAYKIIAGGYLGLNTVARSDMTIACLDFLGLGALLAFYRISRRDMFDQLAGSAWYLCAGLGLLAVMVALPLTGRTSRLSVLTNMVVPPLFFAWLIHKSAVGFTGLTGRVLEAKPLQYCGKISYGIYIYHPFVAVLTMKSFQQMGVSMPQNMMFQFVLLTSLTLLVSSTSWFIFERHFINLKNRFNYQTSHEVT